MVRTEYSRIVPTSIYIHMHIMYTVKADKHHTPHTIHHTPHARTHTLFLATAFFCKTNFPFSSVTPDPFANLRVRCAGGGSNKVYVHVLYTCQLSYKQTVPTPKWFYRARNSNKWLLQWFRHTDNLPLMPGYSLWCTQRHVCGNRLFIEQNLLSWIENVSQLEEDVSEQVHRESDCQSVLVLMIHNRGTILAAVLVPWGDQLG